MYKTMSASLYVRGDKLEETTRQFGERHDVSDSGRAEPQHQCGCGKNGEMPSQMNQKEAVLVGRHFD